MKTFRIPEVCGTEDHNLHCEQCARVAFAHTRSETLLYTLSTQSHRVIDAVLRAFPVHCGYQKRLDTPVCYALKLILLFDRWARLESVLTVQANLIRLSNAMNVSEKRNLHLTMCSAVFAGSL